MPEAYSHRRILQPGSEPRPPTDYGAQVGASPFPVVRTCPLDSETTSMPSAPGAVAQPLIWQVQTSRLSLQLNWSGPGVSQRSVHRGFGRQQHLLEWI